MTSQQDRIVVIGASVAGISAADTLREEGYDGSVTIIETETALPYDRPPLSKEALTGELEDLSVGRPLRDPEHYADNRIELRLGVRALGVDPSTRILRTSEGDVPYDDLIIATGCRARTLRTVHGQDLAVVRTLDDARRLREMAETSSSAVLIGAGFIGLEVASALRRLGLEVTVLGNSPLALLSVVGSKIAPWIVALHERHGVRMVGGANVIAVEGGPGSYSVRTDIGVSVSAQIALAGIGAVPNVEWLSGSGIAVADGITCDGAGRTSVPYVWAAGDVAAYPFGEGRLRVEHWTSAMEQGRHVALNILNGTSTALACLPYAWSDQYDLKMQFFGRMQPGDETEIVEGSLEADEFLALHGNGRSLNAVTCVGASANLRGYRKLLRSAATWQEALSFAGRIELVSTQSITGVV